MEKHQSRNNDKGIRMAMKKIDLDYKRQTWYTENLCITQTVAGNDVRRWQLRPPPISPRGGHLFEKVEDGRMLVGKLELTSIKATNQGRSQKKLMPEAMFMINLWLRQSVNGWVLFLGTR